MLNNDEDDCKSDNVTIDRSDVNVKRKILSTTRSNEQSNDATKQRQRGIFIHFVFIFNPSSILNFITIATINIAIIFTTVVYVVDDLRRTIGRLRSLAWPLPFRLQQFFMSLLKESFVTFLHLFRCHSTCTQLAL